MSTLWTPSGEHPVDRQPGGGPPPTPGGTGSPDDPDDHRPPRRATPGAGDVPETEGVEDLEELTRQLAQTPAEVVVANHCYGLFELAAVYLSQSPPLLPQATLAIDALGALVDGLGDRLGEAATALREALAQVRLAFVQIQAAGSESLAREANGAPAFTVDPRDGGPGDDG
jgi:hypothetical protein